MQRLIVTNLKLGMVLLIVIKLASGVTTVDKVVNDPSLLYQMPLTSDSILNKKVTVNWRFNSFDELVRTLQITYGLNSKVIVKASAISGPILINITNGTLAELIKQTSTKFGYNWSYHDGILFFSAITPIINPANTHESNSLSKPLSSNGLWVLKPGDRTLRNALNSWCKKSGWQLVWNVKADYLITTSWSINGSFEYAVNEILRATQSTELPLYATMHDSNKVLEVFTPINNK